VEGGVSSAELLQTKNTFALKHFRFSIVWLFSDYNALDFCSPSDENEKLMPTLFLSNTVLQINGAINDFQPQSNQPINLSLKATQTLWLQISNSTNSSNLEDLCLIIVKDF